MRACFAVSPVQSPQGVASLVKRKSAEFVRNEDGICSKYFTIIEKESTCGNQTQAIVSSTTSSGDVSMTAAQSRPGQALDGQFHDRIPDCEKFSSVAKWRVKAVSL